MQQDGNLVLYHGNTVLWRSDTNGKGEPPHHVIMQLDNNLVLYDSQQVATWCSGTPCSSGGNSKAVLQNDGNFVIYDGNGDAIWATGTNCSGGDGYMYHKKWLHH